MLLQVGGSNIYTHWKTFSTQNLKIWGGGVTRNFYSTLKLSYFCTRAQGTLAQFSCRNRTCGRLPEAWFQSGATCRCDVIWESLSAARASYAVVTHSIHCCFLSSDCVILCSADMWNRCSSMEQTRFLSALCICRIWESTSWVVFASLFSLVFP